MGIFDNIFNKMRSLTERHAPRAQGPDDEAAASTAPRQAPSPGGPPVAPTTSGSGNVEPEALGELRRALAVSMTRADEADVPSRTSALRWFDSLRGGRHERKALDAVLAAEDAHRARGASLPEELRRAAAAVFVDRGEFRSARTLLEPRGDGEDEASRPSVASWMLLAEAEERDGDWLAARRSLERVLAVDMAHVGVRERVLRLTEHAARLGLAGGAPSAPRAGTASTAALPTLITADPSKSEHRIVAELGRGGASAVFRAEDLALGRAVALKIFHHPDKEREQLLREGRLAVCARGAHVIRIFDSDPDRGVLAMELCGGGSLRRATRTSAGEQPFYTKMDRWLPGLVEALRRVHALGLVHGDVKAANILFRTSGDVVLADFGLARAAGEPYTGGTPGALSPERLRGAAAHPDDDVFALGAMILQLLGGDRDRDRDRGRDLDVAALGLDASARSRWTALATSWTAPRGTRPHDASALAWPP